MTASKWKPFPHSDKDYAYEGAALKKAWPDLHRGDCEPFPDAAFVKDAVARHARLKGALDSEKTAAALQSAWRAYHRGDFGAAVVEGTALGPIGANAANKAANIYATYLETDGRRKREILLSSAERAEALQAAAPDFPNAFYFHAQALGRYAQEISIAKALAQGIGGKVKASLDKTIKLEPKTCRGPYRARRLSRRDRQQSRRNARGPHLRREQRGSDQTLRARPQAPPGLRDRSYRGGERPRHAVRQRETRGGAEAVWRGRSLRPSRRDAEARRGARQGGGVTACGVPFPDAGGKSGRRWRTLCGWVWSRTRCDGNKAVTRERSDATRRAPGRAVEGNPDPRRPSRCFASVNQNSVVLSLHDADGGPLQ